MNEITVNKEQGTECFFQYSNSVPVLISIWNRTQGLVGGSILITVRVRIKGWFPPSSKTFIYEVSFHFSGFQNQDPVSSRFLKTETGTANS
jgi:hypothetical protein